MSGYGHPNKYNYFREIHPDWEPQETAIIEDTAGSTKKAIDAGFENVIGIVVSKFQCLDDNENFNIQKQQEEISKLLEAGARIVVTDYTDISSAIDWMNNGMDLHNVPTFNSQVYEKQREMHSPVSILNFDLSKTIKNSHGLNIHRSHFLTSGTCIKSPTPISASRINRYR